MSEPFQVRLEVRSYELDTQGHVTTAAYLQYADHTRWKLLEAAGVDLEEMRRTGECADGRDPSAHSWPQTRRAELNFIRLMSEILTGLLRVLACTILPLPM
ncbi:acyl-CoA thioesterase [Pseudonocardia adelaidensis]|uniref:Acyl-CoA thioester hydrolase n=1 Tax=Pseudonocardia adelaidensis TaxID=648754 RepID=A0ABP9NK50_9PSEU